MDNTPGMMNSLATWVKANPDQMLQLAGRAAPLVGGRPLAGPLRAIGGITELGMYPGRQKEYLANQPISKEEYAKRTAGDNTWSPSEDYTPGPPPKAPDSPKNAFGETLGGLETMRQDRLDVEKARRAALEKLQNQPILANKVAAAQGVRGGGGGFSARPPGALQQAQYGSQIPQGMPLDTYARLLVNRTRTPGWGGEF